MLLLRILIIVLISISTASANEIWFLNNDHVIELSSFPAPRAFLNPTFLVISITIFIASSFLAIIALDTCFFKFINRKIDPFLHNLGNNFMPITIRIFLGSMLIAASLGYLPRLGMNAQGHSVLFAPEFDLTILTQVNPMWKLFEYAQLIIGIMLIAGLCVRLLCCALMGMIGFCTYKFGFFNFSYAIYYLPPVLALLHYGNGNYFNIFKNFLSLDEVIKIMIPWKRIYSLILITTGLSLIYTGIFHKLYNPNLLIMILEMAQLPNIYLNYDLVTLLIAYIEITMGIMLLIGMFTRQIALCLFCTLIAMSFFTQSPVLYYGHLLSTLFVIILFGDSRLIFQEKKIHPTPICPDLTYTQIDTYNVPLSRKISYTYDYLIYSFNNIKLPSFEIKIPSFSISYLCHKYLTSLRNYLTSLRNYLTSLRNYSSTEETLEADNYW